jgi:hypothetical protein
MTCKHTDREIEIKAHGLLDVRDGKGLGVVCVDGVVWITQSCDPRDIIVHAGESFILDRPCLTLVAAPVGPATIALRAAALN